MLGTELVSQLGSKHDLVGVGRRPAGHLKIAFHVENVADFQGMRRLVQAERPRIVLHAAAMTEVDPCESDRKQALTDNFESTRCVTETANAVGALVVYFSTDFVFDGKKSKPYTEEDIPRPLSVYGETKLLGERYLRLRGKRFFILRASWLFGKHGDDFPKKVLRQAEAGRSFRMVTDQVGNPTFSRDLAEAVAKMIDVLRERGEGKENQIYHMANQGSVSRFELAKFILKRKNYPVELVQPILSDEVLRPAGRPKNSCLSTDKLKKDFGIQLRSWQEAMEAYLQDLVPLGVLP